MTDRAVRRDLPRALVVGGCGGMGLACVRRMAQQHSVLLADIDAARATALAEQLRDEGLSVTAAVCDVTDASSVEKLFAGIDGPLRALIHVVGLAPEAGDWRRIVQVDLQGAHRVARAAPAAMERGAGVFISSVAAHMSDDLGELQPLLDDALAPDFLERLEARHPGPIDPGRAYSISKYGLNRMCRRLAATWGAAGHRIISLSPGLIATPMGERSYEATPAKYQLLERTPLGREGALPEIVDAVEFLCSDRASFITGTDLLVDGGLAAALGS